MLGNHVRAAAVIYVLALPAASLLGCDPYSRFTGEVNAGAVDPVNFPADYLGSGGSAMMAGEGMFIPVAANTGVTAGAGKPTSYYLFHLTAAQTALMSGTSAMPIFTVPLTYTSESAGSTFVQVGDVTGGTPGITPGTAYVFSNGCVAPANYTFNFQRDAVNDSQQGTIFNALPGSSGYVPIVLQVSVQPKGEPCQAIKSETTLLTSSDVQLAVQQPTIPMAPPVGIPDKPFTFHVYPIIDPAAQVVPPGVDPMSLASTSDVGYTLQSWGWYGQYLLAYLDGGTIPYTTSTSTVTDASTNTNYSLVTAQLTTQNLYYPAVSGIDANGAPIAGSPGSGNDVLEFGPKDAGYSPLCHVYSYTLSDANGLPVIATDVSKLETKGVPNPALTTDTGSYVYCVQLQ